MGVISTIEAVLARDGEHSMEAFMKAARHTTPLFKIALDPSSNMREVNPSAFKTVAISEDASSAYQRKALLPISSCVSMDKPTKTS